MADQKAVFAVRLEAAMRVKPFVSSEEVRYYLNGVCIEPAHGGGAVCVATDGHRLGARFDREGFCEKQTIVRMAPELKLLKGMLRSPWLVGVETSPGKGFVAVVDAAPKPDDDTAANAIERVEDCSIRIGRAFVDGTFPDWRRVIPQPSEKDTVRAFNGDYIKAFGKGITMRGADETAPHLVQMHDDPLFVGVLMPMRNDVKSGLPDWVAAPVAPQRKELA